ncbi:MAG: PDZ domain-containing protein [Planctomycetota bacterium]
MKRRTSVSILIALSALASCTTYFDQHSVGAESYMLAQRTGPNGLCESYHLDIHSSVGDASLRIVTEYDSERAFLGFQLVELDRQQAERRGVRPFSGMLVQGVYPRSSAQQASVLGGDVLLSLDQREIVYLSQLAQFEATLRKDQVVSAKVLRGQSELELTLATKMLKEKVSDTQDVPLDAPPDNPRAYAGVVLRGIPAVWCEKISGERRQAVVVTSIEVGSPAWVAGVRGGDVIDTVDGEPAPTAAVLSRRIAEGGASGQSMEWGVHRGPEQRHEATVQLHDYSGESNMWVPLIFKLRNGVYEDSWSVGPFGLLLSNRHHYVADQSTRDVATRNVFNAVLGLFHVESAPDRTHVRLLWIIHFDT